jgi:hypothetical protein
MKENLYDEYFILVEKEKEITLLKDKMREAILIDMSKRKVDKEVHALGSFTIAKLKRWTYSEKVKTLEQKYKASKAKEESTGVATYTDVDSLKVTPSKTF